MARNVRRRALPLAWGGILGLLLLSSCTQVPRGVGASRENFGPQRCLDDLVRHVRVASEVLASPSTSDEQRHIVLDHLARSLRETAGLMQQYGWSNGHDVSGACTRLTDGLHRTQSVLQDEAASEQSRRAARAAAYVEVLCLLGYIEQLKDASTFVERLK